ncbi:MAG: LysM peptidoglycan-binding domain-containing protein [Anaerolineae bacterium]
MKLRACLLIVVACGLVACGASAAATQPVATPTIAAPPTEPPTPTPEPTVYVVVQGDTLSRIARSFGVTVEALAELNNIEDPNRISVGQVLVIPTPVELAAAEETTPTPPPATATPTETATAVPSPTVPTPTATLRPSATPVPTVRRRIIATPTPTATLTATTTASPTLTATASATPSASPTVTASLTASPTAGPLPTGTPPPAEINGSPEDEALAAALQEALATYDIKRVVIADAREQGGARVAIGTLYLTAEAESSGEELTLPLGAIFVTAYQVVLAEGAELDSVAVVIATSDGNAAALIGARLADVAEFVQGALSEEEFVARWVARQF